MQRALAFGVAMLASLAGCDVYDAGLLSRGGHGPSAYVSQCGNGSLDEGELCDISLEEGEPGVCPTSCPREDPCYLQVLAGTRCQTQCVGLPTTTALNGDRCCPPGVGPGEDSDCGSCGDGIIGPAETCEPPEKCPTREGCYALQACVVVTFSGDPAGCSSRCSLEVVAGCHHGDGCCPAGCNAESDDDCSTTCGNGSVELESGETCEPGSPSSPCPASCDDGIPCTTDVSSGSVENCNVSCSNVEITEPATGDGCCPLGAHALNDPDCLPVCGNQVPEPGEQCDGACPASCDDGDPCTVDSRSGDANTCDVVCTHTTITATTAGDDCCPDGANATTDSDCLPVCGNGVLEGSEECEGGPLCGAQCQQLFHPSLVHRYAFEGSSGTVATDSVGGSNGTIVNTSLNGSGDLVLAGGTSDQYVDLPNGIIKSLTNATVEVWLTWRGGEIWQRVFDFGNNNNGEGQQGGLGITEWFITPRSHLEGIRMVLNFTSGSGGADDYTNDKTFQGPSPALTTNVRHQVVGVFDDDANAARLYVDGALIGSTSIDSGNHLSQIIDNNAWIGRSNYNNEELKATLHEVRIYNQALSTAQIDDSFDAGPDPGP